MSKRTYDANGWLTIKNNPIAKAGVFEYLGSEFGAPDPDRIYSVLVSPEELSKPDFVASFDLMPIIDDHELLGSLGTSTDDRPPIGAMGNTRYEAPYLLSDLKFYSDDAQSQIDGGKVELSTAYTCDWIPEEGIFEGQPYQYRQVIKAANHLALVDQGRFGKDVAVLNGIALNSMPIKGDSHMTLEELLAAISGLSDEDKAALLAALSSAENEDEDEKEAENATEEVKNEEPETEAEVAAEAVVGLEAAVEAVEEAVEAVEEAIVDVEAIEEAAMNKAVKHIDARNAMAAKVKPFIGQVPAVAMNSAESVAEYTCKKLGVPFAKGTATVVLNAYLHGRKPVSEQAKAAQNAAPVSGESIKSKLWGAK